jgi:ribosomal protein S18 acetylase RimI-like enzyme
VRTDVRAFQGGHLRGWPNVRFRPAVDADMPVLVDLYASARAAEMALVAWPEEAKRQFLDQQCRLQDEHYRRHYVGADFWLVLLDGAPIGRVYVHRTRADLRLMEITLLPEQRGKGLGRALLAELIDESERQGVQLSLHVEPDNPARMWYERLGFQREEERGVYWFMTRQPVGRVTRQGEIA